MSSPTDPPPPPLILVLHGARGDLARRLVIPSLATLHRRGLLPDRWALLGTGRTTISAEEFEEIVRGSIEEFGQEGTTPDDVAALTRHAQFTSAITVEADAGLGVALDEMRQVLTATDELAEGGDRTQSTTELDVADVVIVHYLAIPPDAFEPLTKALGAHGLNRGPDGRPDRAGGLREAPRDVTGQLPRAGRRRAPGARRGAGVPDRPLPGQGGHPEPARAPVRQRAVRQRLGPTPRGPGPDRRAGDARRRPARRVLRRDRRRPGHGRLAPVPGGRAGRDGAAAPPGRNRPGARPRRRDRRLPAAGPGQRRGARSVRRLSGHRRGRRRVPHRHLHRRPPVDRQRPVARGAVPAPHREEDDRLGPAGQPAAAPRPGPDLDLATGTARLDLDDVSGGEPLPPYASLLDDVLSGDRTLFTTPIGLEAAWRAFEPLLGPDRPDPHPYAPDSWGPSAAADLAAPHGWILPQG